MALKEHIVELASKIEKDLTYVKADHAITEEGTFEKNLPETLTMQVVNDVNAYESDYVAASTLAFGRMAVSAIAKDKTVDTVSGSFKMAGDNKVDHVVHREKEYRNPQKPGETIVNYGDNSSVYQVAAGRNVGQIKQARMEIKRLAAEAFGK